MKNPSYKTLKKKAWAAFSLWIRNRGSRDGMNTCVTCGVVEPIAELQAGHFIPGRHLAVLFDPLGVYPQCVGCNVFKHGNSIPYTLWMQKKYGPDFVEKMLRESHRIVKLSRDDYEKLIALYSA